MTASDWQALNTLLETALDLPPEARAAYLARVSATNPALAEEASRLLELDQRSGDSLERWLQDQARGLLMEEPASLAGVEIGPYRITEELGRGGMGVVYKAIRRFGDADRPLAFKILTGGWAIRGRLGSEQAMLARLDHPNVARIIDGGTLEDGTPYLVMDYVDGVPIDQFCDTRRLTCERRLQLFLQVCSAVNCAHQNLIVHCDLKPKNILVTGDGTPHLLDFGIARLESQGSSEGGTDRSLGVMTLDYASPEQILGHPVNTLSDVYSLGVLLYELLTGCRPLPLTGNRTKPEEAESGVRCPPSRAVTSSAVDSIHRPSKWRSEEVARNRRIHPRGLESLLRGDLDAIVLKAIEREAGRRYSSVVELSEDIERYLESWPVSVRGSTWPYRASRFARRHRVGVSLSVAAVVLMLATVAVVLWQANVARAEKERARFESRRAERISEFLQRILTSADVSWYNDGKAKGPNVTVRQVLDEASRNIESEFADAPELKAAIHHTIGNTYRALTLLKESEQHFRKALELRQETFPPNHPKIAESYYFLGAVRKRAGDFEEASHLFGEAYKILSSSGRDEANFLFLLADLADLCWRQGRLEEGERLAGECLAKVGPSPPRTESMAAVSAKISLAHIMMDRSRFVDAARHFRSALDGADWALRDADSDLGSASLRRMAYCRVAEFYLRSGCRDQAEEALAVANKSGEQMYPRLESIECLMTEGELACLKGRFREAAEKAEAASNVTLEAGLANRFFQGRVRLLRGRILLGEGRPHEAEKVIRAALEDFRGIVLDGGRVSVEARSLLARSLLTPSRSQEVSRGAEKDETLSLGALGSTSLPTAPHYTCEELTSIIQH